MASGGSTTSLSLVRNTADRAPVGAGGSRKPHVVVIGGGISGLAAALTIHRRSDGRVRVTLVEASGELGGKLRVSEVEGVPVDEGAESFLATRPEAVLLARDVGLADDLVEPEVFQGAIWSRGKPRFLPKGQIMGLPTDLQALARSEVLSLGGLLRIPLDHIIPPTPLESDISVGAFVTGRVGREVLERMVEPLLGGVYAGRADELSLEATMPSVYKSAQLNRSLLSAARDVQKGGATSAGARRGAAFRGVRGGVGRLATHVVDELRASGVEILTDMQVRQLARTADGWRITAGTTRSPMRFDADGVVLATPAPSTSKLLSKVNPAAAAALAEIDYASVAVVTLAYRVSDVSATLRGSGFLIPPVEGRQVKAVTFASRKWHWLSEQAGPDLVMIRASLGRQGDSEVLNRDDKGLVAVSHNDLVDFIGATAKPVATRVTRWNEALPQYAVGHRTRIDRIKLALRDEPTLGVCGAAFEGVGIAACVGSAQHASAGVLRHVVDQPQWAHGW